MKAPFRMCQMTVVCANTTRMLYELNLLGVDLHHLRMIDELTVMFYVRQSLCHRVNGIIERSGGKVIHCALASGNILMKSFLHRPVLILGAMMLLFLTLYIPTRILFVTVSGNHRIPQRHILSVASDSGVHFGVARHEVRSEKVKNRLLSALPELKWVGVNTYGCVAQISVQERAPQESIIVESAVSSIIASRDGVIREMTVRRGNPICHVGQAVKKGQLLVSGYSDCGRCIYGTQADAEIYAQTSRSLKLSMLSGGLKRGDQGSVKRKYCLIVGKKRINFYKGSGIYDTTCVRMYVEYPLTLPGGFQLPVALAVQEEIDYCPVPMNITLSEAETVLDSLAKDYLKSQMIAGQVKNVNYQMTESENALHLIGQYICDEMIGKTHSEEIVNNYE